MFPLRSCGATSCGFIGDDVRPFFQLLRTRPPSAHFHTGMGLEPHLNLEEGGSFWPKKLWRTGWDSRSPVAWPWPVSLEAMLLPLATLSRSDCGRAFAARVSTTLKQLRVVEYPSNPTHAKAKTTGAQVPADFASGGTDGSGTRNPRGSLGVFRTLF